MRKPSVFIGSSSEGESIAYAIQENLEAIAEPYVWTQGVFELGDSYIESLIKELDKADFAILVLTEDDVTISGGKENVSPRDNVLFELGLFIGRLGRNRSFFVYDKLKDIKIPSDLAGISGAAFTLHESGNLAASLGSASNKIRNAIANTGNREKIDLTQADAFNKQNQFCKKVTGYWWERIKPDSKSALSFVHIEFDETILMLKLKGRTYDINGNYSAHWESKSAGIQINERKTFYQWEGWFTASPSEPIEGFGEIFFSANEDAFMEANGIFSNISIVDLKSIHKSSFDLRRASENEIATMHSKDKQKIGDAVANKMDEMD